jgi:UDPglucose--hexose-1-phosphate uridylyltransferase
MRDLNRGAHLRFNPLTGEWVLVSANRLQRPWQGEIEHGATPERPQYDPDCYLCPGNLRANGERNPVYEQTFVFNNDYPALRPQDGTQSAVEGLLRAQGEPGTCRVICFSPRHDLDVAKMDSAQIRRVIDAWAQQYEELGSLPYVNAITIFENRGAMMGASNPHPHCQVWAEAMPPTELLKESQRLAAYAQSTGNCMLCSYAQQETACGERIVYENAGAIAVVPFWAVWPFETLIVPRSHAGSLSAVSDADRNALSDAMREVTSRYDRLFAAPFPYSMGIHQRPADGAPHEHWHTHAHYFPPLLRSLAVRKFMVGYEMLGQPQRDITPEEAARRLREL